VQASSGNPDIQERIEQIRSQCAQAVLTAQMPEGLHIDLAQSYDHVIDMLAKIAEFKDHTTGSHIKRIDHYTRLLALELGSGPEEAILFGKASRLHAVGKVGISDATLCKPGRLTTAEFDIVRAHTHIGSQILENDRFLTVACGRPASP
jgi:putative two-component system response regulator